MYNYYVLVKGRETNGSKDLLFMGVLGYIAANIFHKIQIRHTSNQK